MKTEVSAPQRPLVQSVALRHLGRVEDRGGTVGLDDARREKFRRHGGRILRQREIGPAPDRVLALDVDPLQRGHLLGLVVADAVAEPLLDHHGVEAVGVRRGLGLGDQLPRLGRGRLRFPLGIRLVDFDIDVGGVDRRRRVVHLRRGGGPRRLVGAERRLENVSAGRVAEIGVLAHGDAVVRIVLGCGIGCGGSELLPRGMRIGLKRLRPEVRKARQVDLPIRRRGREHVALGIHQDGNKSARIARADKYILPRGNRIERGLQVSRRQPRTGNLKRRRIVLRAA